MTMIDTLEPRRLFAGSLLRVSSVTADNRGEILVQFSERATGVKGAAFQVYTAGADGKLYTSDDKRETVGFTYSKGKKLLRIIANLTKDTPYRLKLDGKSRIRKESDNSLLDGDFVSGTRASGDGVAGGNYEMQVTRDKSATPTVKMRTALGDINLRIRKDVAPISADAFLVLLNKGSFDRLLITRSVGDIIQLGGIQYNGNGDTTDSLADLTETVAKEFGDEVPVLSNIRGTVSFARSSTTGAASTEFFFNLGDNSPFDEAGGGGPSAFAPFAEVTTSQGFDTLDAVAAKETVGLNAGGFDLNGDGDGVDGQDIPVNDVAAVNAEGRFRPARDGIYIERTAILSVVVSKNA